MGTGVSSSARGGSVRWRARIAVALTAAVLAGVAALAWRSAARDRASLVEAFADDHLLRLRIAIREIESELAGVRQHLEFAARLVDVANSGSDQRRELEALLTVARDYRLIVVYDVQGNERIVAMDRGAASSASRAALSEGMRGAARAAMERHGLAISEPLGEAASPWLRAFATPLSRDGQLRGALVILVDQKSTFERLRLVAPETSAKLLVLGPHGQSAPLTDPAVVPGLAPGASGPMGDLQRRMRAGHTGTAHLPRAAAAELGLGAADAVAVFAPIQTGDAGYWSVAVLDTTATLRSQEHAIFLQMTLFAGILALALGSLSAYLVLGARRAIAFQERLRSAEEVARVREKAEKMLENVPVAVVALDDAGRISAVNVAARERLPAAVPGAPLAAAFAGAPPRAVDELRALVEGARASEAVQRILTPPIAIGDGRFSAHAVPLAHPLPDITLLLVLEDVTEMHALSSQLLRAEKLATVGILAAGIAHEVGTPLGVVRGRAELLGARLGAGSPHAEHARVIVEEIDRISRTIQELLDFSRVSKGPAGAVRLDEVAANVAELLAFEARTREVALAVDVARGLGPLAANGDQLKQALVNLTLNALHACAPGGRVAVKGRAEPGGRRACIEVVDDGAGIPQELLHRVFDPFFTTKKRGKGTGLGLTVAAQVIRSHGGEIDLESAVGQGTRVLVRWPLARGGAEELDGDGDRRAHSGGR
jgi:signal transduction histidine kinase